MNDFADPAQPSRRDFLKTSTLAASGALAANLAFVRSAHAAGSDLLKVGLIGCGGRGSGAAAQALRADANTKLVAMGDAFSDRLENSLQSLSADPSLAARIDVPAERRFTGFDAYKQVIDSDVDVVLLATSPHFRPLHFKYAVEKNKHCFVEKPVAVDAPGVRSILATTAEAKKRGLAVVSGLCYRYDLPKRELVKRVYDGAIGDVTAMHVSYNTGTLWHRGENPAWSDMEYQMRNWLYYTWLSGDFNVEQHIHSLDKAAWVMHDKAPIRATGLGGRQVRTDAKFGHIYDHMSVIYEYDNGVKLFANCRQMAGCSTNVSDHLFGTKGSAEMMAGTISGENQWKFRGAKPNMYDVEHQELFASIRSGNPINNGEYMATSTMLAIMGRMACYTGKTLTWEECFNSKEDLTPAKYEWGPLPTPAVAAPGVTTFV